MAVRPGLLRLLPEASPALCAILDPARGPLAPPIRSEIFGVERFEQHGRSLGDTHRAERGRWWSPTFHPRLRDNIAALREAQGYIGAQAATGYDISPAAEWLLDNFHLIEAQIRAIRDGLPRAYFRALPLLQDPPLAGLPRVYGIAWAYVAHTDGAFDEDLLVAFLMAYQQTRELQLGELWALPTTLRVVLIEELRRIAERVAANKAAREAANLCGDRIESCPLSDLDELRALMDRRGVGRVFLAQLAQRLHDHRTDATRPALTDHHAWLRDALPDLAAAQAQHSADQAADNLSVSNALKSLRTLGDAEWTGIVARTSPLMRLMLGSPLFEAEHTTTRDQTLHAIERLARRSGRSESDIAQALLACLQAARDTDEQVAGHWLDGPGRPALLARLALHETLARRCRGAAHRLVLPLYLAALGLGTLALVWAVLLRRPLAADLGTPWPWLAAALALFPAAEAVVAVLSRLIAESVRPQHLPRLALAAGIPIEHRVLVVIPALLGDAAAIARLAHRLLLHQLANAEDQAQFALLTDWADADTAQLPSDAALLAQAVRQVRELNTRHGTTATAGAATSPRFLLLHRPRRYSETEQRWIGWERKRGKLEALVAALAEERLGAFTDLGELSRLAPGTRYIVTLDSDTQLPPGRLRELVGVAAHPQNRPRLAPDGRSVASGYGILQPRVATPLPAAGQRTPYHWMFAGQGGMDPYSAASSELYQDVFGEGSFSGKGLLDVHTLQAVLAARLPAGCVLSHDLLEGSLVRSATVSDIVLAEEAPCHADVASARLHRWTRGDWQLLPLLLSGHWRLRAINRWKMIDNLRRSLVAPMSLALLLMALAGHGLAPGAALALVLAAAAAGPLLGALAALSPSRYDIAWRHFYRQALEDLARALAGGLWHLALLLHDARLAADAIARAAYRMAVSRRHLLQWTTAASVEARLKTDLASQGRRHAIEPVLALGLFAALLLLGSPALAWALPLCLLWAAAPVWIWWSGRPRAADAALSVQHRAFLEGVARDTWRLFERTVVAEDHHLPPDNLQVLPQDMTAHRTSPTNIGMYLLSAACARRFGWIDTAELVTRLEATLATLATLPRHRGHFLNWYDTLSCAPLLPMYVSTVDSGNLSGHLLAVAAACRELARDDLANDRLRALGDACERLAWEPEFGFLYHRQRHLLHIGYRVAEQQLDASFYDLLASESRLTSLLAIAKGDLPVRHWSALGRPFYAVGATAGLRSWSGSMFEYLMPGLVLEEPPGSVLDDACHAALREQALFAAGLGVPWGISESAYAGRDHTLAYQYAPQGVPRLALRRTPPDELVIAPYATALAAQVDVARATANFTALQALAARGRYGFIEALDYSPGRQALGERFTPVAT